MYTLLFRNRLAALGFVLLMIISAISLVGTEDQEGVITKTANEIEAQKAEFESAVEAVGPPKTLNGQGSEEETPIEFLDDEELIDSAEGFDPTPDDEFNPESLAEQEEVVIVLENEQRPETE
ncbi:hypothetical protein GCM10023115_02200 [Pontixanthobacter gangjinensis]|uniref:Uncharacterized protein n=1 Tax=Pontixanthobacter gangjinensis TaxID=1028742 RepID=A0A6I4SIL9_9SPHN|nr:hypothetical protein [Pontixanthobacter gangjinensis]MXO55473.1 hypothetical protein [Pontixanthobacter gangjinensis]